METIEFTPGEQLGYEGVHARQTSDGTIFYVKRECNGADELIYAIRNGQTVTTTKSWEGDIDKFDAFGELLYFLTYSQKIYMATFHQPSQIRVEFVRNVDKLDTHEIGMLFSRLVNGRKLVYRACDHYSKGIPMDLDDLEDDELEIASVHRNNVIMQNEIEVPIKARRITHNIIAVDTPVRINSLFARNIARYVYLLTDKRQLTVLDTETMKHNSFSLRVPETDAKDVSFWNVVGVHENTITLWGKSAGTTSFFVATAPV